MLNPTARESLDPMDSQAMDRNMGNVVSKKLWLPKILYDALPFFYLASGFLALVATVYVSAWFWVLPHYLLFSAACVHLGLTVFRRRSHGRDGGRQQG